jgi:hypothetical protein
VTNKVFEGASIFFIIYLIQPKMKETVESSKANTKTAAEAIEILTSAYKSSTYSENDEPNS